MLHNVFETFGKEIAVCYVMAIVVSILCSRLMIISILNVSHKKHLYDTHDERKIHHGLIPRIGGIAFCPSILFVTSLVLGITSVFGFTDFKSMILSDASMMHFGLCALILMYFTGILDDLIGMKYDKKLIFQIMCGLMMVAANNTINNLYGLFGIYELPTAMAHFLTIFCTVLFLNAINMVDGIDGLASGMCVLSSVFYGFSFTLSGNFLFALLAFSLLGVMIPFFYYNVFGSAKTGNKIFMGDCGSLSIGMINTFLAIKYLNVVDTGSANTFMLAMLPFAIPCLDVVRVFFIRLQSHKSPFLPDRNHAHHILLDVMGSPRRTLAVLLPFATLHLMLYGVLSMYVNVTILAICISVFYFASMYYLNKQRPGTPSGGNDSKEKHEEKSSSQKFMMGGVALGLCTMYN